jgi:hypothetical protein
LGEKNEKGERKRGKMLKKSNKGEGKKRKWVEKR